MIRAVRDRLCSFVSWKFSYVEMILKTDLEASSQMLISEMKRHHLHKTLIEVPSKYSHQSNGLTDNETLRIEVVAKNLNKYWLVDHVARLITSFVLKINDRSKWNRFRGKKNVKSNLIEIVESTITSLSERSAEAGSALILEYVPRLWWKKWSDH